MVYTILTDERVDIKAARAGPLQAYDLIRTRSCVRISLYTLFSNHLPITTLTKVVLPKRRY